MVYFPIKTTKKGSCVSLSSASLGGGRDVSNVGLLFAEGLINSTRYLCLQNDPIGEERNGGPNGQLSWRGGKRMLKCVETCVKIVQLYIISCDCSAFTVD